jgi:TRAP-type C4-dicarboxylate transport system permease small subunit
MTSDNNSLSWLDKFDTWLVRFTIITGGLGLSFMVLLTFFNVIVMRKILNDPILGAEDVMVLNLVLIVSIAIPFGGRVGAHIEIEIFDSWISPTFSRWSQFVLRLLATALVMTLAYRLYDSGVSAHKFGEATQQLLISYEPYYYIMAVLVAVYSLILFSDAVQLWVRGEIKQIGSSGETAWSV